MRLAESQGSHGIPALPWEASPGARPAVTGVSQQVAALPVCHLGTGYVGQCLDGSSKTCPKQHSVGQLRMQTDRLPQRCTHQAGTAVSHRQAGSLVSLQPIFHYITLPYNSICTYMYKYGVYYNIFSFRFSEYLPRKCLLAPPSHPYY